MNKDIIYCVTDEDVGFVSIKDDSPLETRMGARGIVLNKKGEMAVFNKRLKNEFKLPGGGVDPDEDFILAFKRECKEEIGCEIDEIYSLGVIIEKKSRGNFEQTSHVFIARQKGELKTPKLTQKEKDEGAVCLWMDPNAALEKMRTCLENLKESKYDSIYRTKFMVFRDIKILEYYLEKIKN